MVYFAIFIIPFFFCLNGFCIGNILKKSSICVNKYFAYFTGILFFFAIYQLVFIFMYLMHSKIIYFYYFVGISQLLCLIWYAINYKYFFNNINDKANWIFLLTFLVAIIFLVVFNCLIPVDRIVSTYGKSLFEYLKAENFNIYNTISLPEINNNFSSLNIFTAIFKNLFLISGEKDASIFFQYSYSILYAVCASLGFTAIFSKSKNITIGKIFFLIIFEIIFLFLNFSNSESSILGKCWIGILLIYFWYAMFMIDDFNNDWNIYFIWLSLFSFTSFNQDGILFSFCLGMFAVFYYGIHKKNTFDLFIGEFLMLALQFINTFYILKAEIWWIIYDVLIVLLFCFHMIQKNKTSFYKIYSTANGAFNESIKAIYFLVAVTIYFVSIYSIVNFGRTVDFYLYKYDYIWTYSLTHKSVWIMNIVLWVFYVVCIISWLAYIFIAKRNKIYNDSFIYYVFMLALFVNPLAMQIMQSMFSDFNENISEINYLLVSPVFFHFDLFNKKNIGKKIIIINNN